MSCLALQKCDKGFFCSISTSQQEEGVTVTMKNLFVFGLLLLSSCIYLTNQTKQACEGREQFMCGNVCLEYGKTCKCKNDEFKVNAYNTEICCAPSENCTKDNQGKLFLN